MAFTGAFSPSLCPQDAGNVDPACAARLGVIAWKACSHEASPCASPNLAAELHRPDLGELPPLDLGPGTLTDEVEDEGCQFAPLLMLRRTQVEEATAVARERAHWGIRMQPGELANSFLLSSAEDQHQNALDAMDALHEASRSAEALYEEVLGTKLNDGMNMALHRVPDVSAMKVAPCSETQELRIIAPEHPDLVEQDLSESQDDSNSLALKRPQDEGEDPEADCIEPEDRRTSFAEAAVSVAEALLAIASAPVASSNASGGGHVSEVSSAMPCVEGWLRVDGDLAMDVAVLRDMLRSTLRRLLEPLAQVRKIVLTTPRMFPAERRGTGRDGACSFSYRISVADRHDVEPLRETLLLEAECGGARRLLPLLAEQLCEEGRDMPRHLKVRLEVQSGL